MKIRVNQIVKDDDIYPRVRVSHETIKSYMEAIRGGATFPPILVQNVKEDGQEKIVILDGYHRLEAYRSAGLEEIEATFWKEEVLDKKGWLEQLRIISGKANVTHGDRLTETDLKFQCVRIVEDRPLERLTGIIKELAAEFGVSEGYMSRLVGTEVRRRKASRNALVFRLKLLGWTYREIAEVAGLSFKEVGNVCNNFDRKLFTQEHRSGLTPEQIAEQHNLDEPLVWAILLEGKDDIERFKLFGKSEYGNDQPKLSDYWKFSKRDPRLGQANYPGNLYGQEAMNIIYRFSRQGDLVVDPMAGGGVTVDACLVLNRRCRAYDIDPSKSGRKDIEQHDALQEFPPRAQNCDLIILDPPYYKKKEREYECFEFTKDRETYLNNLAIVARNCYQALKENGYLALLHGQYIDYDDEEASILNSHLARLFEEVGFRHILTIESPLTFDTQWHGPAVEEAKRHDPWRILPVTKDWYIFKKTK